ncbi:MAG: HNH endonuclease family protein [Candidatus Saccharibacteria bacterium]|nr:HNH endonuclease family protein [Candidatus Saccharibacteria bacterium]
MFRLGHKFRRLIIVLVAVAGIGGWLVLNPDSYEQVFEKIDNASADLGIDQAIDSVAGQLGLNVPSTDGSSQATGQKTALEALAELETKGRSPKTNYDREQRFYSSWPTVDGCNLRQRIIKRDFGDNAVLDGCTVISGEYDDPYTGQHLVFNEKSEISSGIQIDHVVALSDAWQKGADLDHMDDATRYELATDPLNLLAVDSGANQAKKDGDAATWLPKNKSFRCQYVARQVSVKYKYHLWVTAAEREAIENILSTCPNEPVLGL